MNQLLPYVLLDGAIVVGIILLSLRILTFFHPLLYYIVFHLFAISSRAWELLGGRYPMYYGYVNVRYYSAVRPEEFTRALIYADAGLIFFFVGCILAKSSPTTPRQPVPYDDGVLRQLLIALLPITFVLLLYRRLGGADATEVLTSFQLLNIMTIWPIGLLTLAVARWGPRWYFMVPALVYLGLVATQGYHRVQTLLPFVLLLGVFTARRNGRWPSAYFLPLVVGALILFPSLKQFGKDFQKDGFTTAVSNIGRAQAAADDRYNSRSEMLLDQYAGALTAADSGNVILFGESYYALLTLPIPRSWWAEKPSLGSAMLSIQTPGRPYGQEGRIVTLIGESYINFRLAGVFVILTGLGWILTRYYLKAFSVAPLDPYKVAYIGIMGSLFQVYRDGLLSLVLFSVISMAPLYIYLLLNGYTLRAQATARERAAFARGRLG